MLNSITFDDFCGFWSVTVYIMYKLLYLDLYLQFYYQNWVVQYVVVLQLQKN